MGKRYCLSVLLFLSINALAQGNDTLHKDTTKQFLIKDPKAYDKKSKVLWLVDDKRYYRHSPKKSWAKDTSNILDITVLNGNVSRAKYGEPGQNGTIIVTTKKYAIKTYQNEFSNLSVKYKQYLKHSHNRDDSVGYVVNGIFFDGKAKSVILKLYEIPSDKIKTLDIIENQFRNGNPQRELVIITTKK